jgi:hypothetical protein
VGPRPNQKQAFDLSPEFGGGRGPDRRRLGPHQTVFFKFNTKYLCGIGVGSPFDADSQSIIDASQEGPAQVVRQRHRGSPSVHTATMVPSSAHSISWSHGRRRPWGDPRPRGAAVPPHSIAPDDQFRRLGIPLDLPIADRESEIPGSTCPANCSQ